MKLLLPLLFLLGSSLLQAADSTPNLIVIMTDDLGYADVGFNGCQDIPTPHIDRIADEGVVFSNGYVAYPVCGPSRAGFMTGRYQQRFGFERNPQYRTDDPNMGLPLSEDTIASVLMKVGYTSGVVGKWHLGAHPDLHPLSRGFDFFHGHLGGGHRYFPEELVIKDSYEAKDEPQSYRTWILRNHKPVKPTKYLTDDFSDAAVEFLEMNWKNPFFLFLSYNAPHTPLQATEKYLKRFDSIDDKRRKTYAAMVSAVDDGVGRVLDKLDELELAENTLVFFLSDNGGPTTKNASLNTPLRGGKSDVWEGGHRVPFALRWSGELPSGVTYENPVTSLDILATIAGLSGAAIAEDRPLDGVNLVPFLKKEAKGIPHKVLYLRKWDQKRYSIRRGRYKLVIPGADAKPQLFNLSKDIAEKNNILFSNKEIATELEKLLRKWESELMEPQFLGLIHTDAWQNRSRQ
ncbi:MAG: sulfatase-like hydrolase/transferase [Puniceicoccaceae bacterium]